MLIAHFTHFGDHGPLVPERRLLAHTRADLVHFFCLFVFLSPPTSTNTPPAVFRSLSSSFSLMSAVPCEEDYLPESDVDDDLPMDPLPSRPPSVNASASSSSLATPSSAISQPSGLPVATIARLTHDELRVNTEFMRYVNMVNFLLNNMWEKTPANRKSLIFPPFPTFLTFIIASHVTSSSGLSLHPSDSASQVSPSPAVITPSSTIPLPALRLPSRPDHYPITILWMYMDCQKDPNVHTSTGNKSRPPMRQIIRHKNGERITADEWKEIRQSVVTIKHTRLDVLSITQTLRQQNWQPRPKLQRPRASAGVNQVPGPLRRGQRLEATMPWIWVSTCFSTLTCS